MPHMVWPELVSADRCVDPQRPRTQHSKRGVGDSLLVSNMNGVDRPGLVPA
jgi:hypothetical protein